MMYTKDNSKVGIGISDELFESISILVHQHKQIPKFDNSNLELSNGYFVLNNRAVISVKGNDGFAFLQGILTNDISPCKEGKLVYSLMLNAQGKLLYDFFIYHATGNNSEFWLDCPKEYLNDLIDKFKLYKLRADVAINLAADMAVVIAEKSNAINAMDKLFLDPRNEQMGYRGIVRFAELNNINNENNNVLRNYNITRLNLKLTELENDLIPGKFFPLELGLDKFNSISFNKGCYIGQEVIARTYHQGVIRKGVYLVELANFDELKHSRLKNQHIVSNDDEKIGIMLGTYGEYGLALLKTELLSYVNAKGELEEKKLWLFESHFNDKT